MDDRGAHCGRPSRRQHEPRRAPLLQCIDHDRMPTSLDQEVGEGLGAQAGEARLSEVIRSEGFNQVRRVVTGPFNMVLEARLSS